ncbi:MAG: toll/interleukin-1 receptor domain-containing protein [Gammaproteobacteria bacterium]|nr:toll/interleukin-1 receptor domain-containing protein [Gammaproteobacteria bacterium]
MDVFISYSHKDRDWKERIATFMRCMQIQNRFDYATWDDGEINPGEDWRDHIMNAIDKCKIAVLLVSPDFLASEFILKQEVPRLEDLRDQGQVHIVPVIIRPCTWEIVDLLVKLQLHPADGSALSGKSDMESRNN